MPMELKRSKVMTKRLQGLLQQWYIARHTAERCILKGTERMCPTCGERNKSADHMLMEYLQEPWEEEGDDA